MMTEALLPLLFCLPYLLATPVLDSTVEPTSHASTTSPPDVKSNTGPVASTTLPTANSTFDQRLTATTSSAFLSDLNTGSQGDNRRAANVSQTAVTQTSAVGQPADVAKSHKESNNTVMSENDKAFREAQPRGNTPLYINPTEIKMYKTLDPVESNNHTPPTGINRTPYEKTVQDGDFSSPECKEGGEERRSHPHSSKLVCFITLWVLGVTAALFLGLTIWLGLRLSAQRERDRRGSGEQPPEAAKGDDLQNLWVAHKSSVEEQVEFWYANSTMVGQDSLAERPRQTEDHRSKRRREGRKERKEESLWPKVTQKDITDFWYANGKPFPEEPQNQT